MVADRDDSHVPGRRRLTTVRGRHVTPDHRSQVIGHAMLVIDACRREMIPDTDIFTRYNGPYDESDREYDRGMRAAGTGVNAKEVKHTIVRLLSN